MSESEELSTLESKLLESGVEVSESLRGFIMVGEQVEVGKRENWVIIRLSTCAGSTLIIFFQYTAGVTDEIAKPTIDFGTFCGWQSSYKWHPRAADSGACGLKCKGHMQTPKSTSTQ
ncbi:uncharacterized protein LACBIDRAFT_335218 [Laccaria bicolor S238N-H82]|uniref:Predicted protein n=1 Tax=Laccaria bicolor (strain S238N-H82 / ATCC MYA-4686) TaxID=486041 RepID=B0E1Q5_LACBS|nr:uncharacterized protein LACBIDRAFT_335218 [Laccaria bicolor S238N-H82]EDQ99236.1 predicted protein [Laccaria bicolor S238N-H82]|eukprot:XP_001890133.1 predicted protein [Laccaria bicolor S238N-H82]